MWLMIRENPYLAMSVCEFSSPSTVKGDPPVKSSYINTPRLHQSTAWNAWDHPPMTSPTKRTISLESALDSGSLDLIKQTANYLVMSRLSSFYNFWSHIFNGATDRKGPFHLKNTQTHPQTHFRSRSKTQKYKGSWVLYYFGIPVGFPRDGSQFAYSLHNWDGTGKKSMGAGETGIIITIGPFFLYCPWMFNCVLHKRIFCNVMCHDVVMVALWQWKISCYYAVANGEPNKLNWHTQSSLIQEKDGENIK